MSVSAVSHSNSVSSEFHRYNIWVVTMPFWFCQVPRWSLFSAQLLVSIIACVENRPPPSPLQQVVQVAPARWPRTRTKGVCLAVLRLCNSCAGRQYYYYHHCHYHGFSLLVLLVWPMPVCTSWSFKRRLNEFSRGSRITQSRRRPPLEPSPGG